jgi:peptidoglycan-associated lipoprotein
LKKHFHQYLHSLKATQVSNWFDNGLLCATVDELLKGENIMLKFSFRFALIPLLSICLFACPSKPKSSDTAVEAVPVSGDDVSSSPMNFDTAGSDSGRIEGLTTIYFDYDKASLSSGAKSTLQENAAWMKKNSGVKLQIEGHTDARGSLEYNLALGERRANSAKNYLQSLGIPASRLVVISFGKEKPLVNGESEEAFSKNRRANFVPLQ